MFGKLEGEYEIYKDCAENESSSGAVSPQSALNQKQADLDEWRQDLDEWNTKLSEEEIRNEEPADDRYQYILEINELNRQQEELDKQKKELEGSENGRSPGAALPQAAYNHTGGFTMTEQTKEQETKQRPLVGDYLMKIEDVPKEVREYAINKISLKDADGNFLKDENNKEIKANIAVAKENGNYYGQVVLNNDSYIVQAVGKNQNFVVVHPKNKIELQGNTLKTLDEKKQMNGFSIQVHYTGDQAKVYPFKPKEREEAIKEAMTPETLLTQAKEYAEKNIKNSSQRSAFLKHMEAVVERAFPQQQQQQEVKQEKTPSERTQQPQERVR
jgi:hypothetical protein